MAESLSDKIAGILSAAPTSFDPEDDVNEETTARVEANAANSENEDELTTQNLGQFRKQNVELLEEVDKRYEGKRASRKKLGWQSESEIDEGGSEKSSSDSSEISDGDEEYSAEGSEESDSNDEDNDERNIFKDVGKVSGSKSACVRQQLGTWESFLEMRIQLQKSLLTANKMPQSSLFLDIKNNSTADFDLEIRKAVGTVKNLLDKFLLLQMLLFKNYPETKKLSTNTDEKETEEEIPSDTEEEEEEKDSEIPCTKKMKLDEYGTELSRRFELYHNYRNSVLQKWHDKTQIGVNKSGNVIQSVTDQIGHILSNKEKLIRATQLKRTDYDIIGENRIENDENGENLEKADVYNANIFDDTDFYHHLLRELIEFKSSDLTDPIKLGRQWMRLQSLRSKMKKKVDTKATKGRKIRYVVHSKLVNFMAPIEDITWQDSAKTELYNSLFGRNQ